MFFLADKERKILFGWSAKCGCSHIKRIFWFLQNGKIDNQIHSAKDYSSMPDDIEKYTTIIISRNPFKRIVSGFLDKYKPGGEFRYLWESDTTLYTFSAFLDELFKCNWNIVNQHHFTPQTSEKFKEVILNSKSIHLFDIEVIDYGFIERLYNKQIPDELLNYKGDHIRRTYELDEVSDHLYDLNMDDYYNYNVDPKHFYNEDIKNRVFAFYKNDFAFFKKLGIEYTFFE